MEVELKVKHKIENNRIGDGSIVKESLEGNKDNFKKYFSTDEDITFKVIDSDLLQRDSLEPFEYTQEPVPLKCMFEDIKNEQSCLYKKMQEKFNEEDKINNKVNIAMYLLEKYFELRFSIDYSISFGNNKVEFASFYYSDYYFKYDLPREILDDITISRNDEIFSWKIDITLLSIDDFSKYIIPNYYKEIGMHDREHLRKDTSLMEQLSKEWISNSSLGSLD